MSLRWSDGFTMLPLVEGIFGKLKVPGQPDVEVEAAKLPLELEEVGARIEIRRWPSSMPQDAVVRLFVWEDEGASAVTQTVSSVKDGKLRAEAIVEEMVQRLAQREGRGGYRG